MITESIQMVKKHQFAKNNLQNAIILFKLSSLKHDFPK